MNIRGKAIGHDQAPYVIAEIGVNHDGDPARALELTRIAANAGADAVKLQYFKADLLMSRASSLAAYQAAAGERDPREMLRRLELPLNAMAAVIDEAHRLGLAAIVTIFSTELVDECAALPWDAYKSASPDIIHKPLLEAVAALDKPLIVSTGAATLDEVMRAADWLTGVRREQRLAVLQCVSSYPIDLEHAAFGGIVALKRELAGVPIGYSDHTREEETGALAASCGACILEKHLTDDRTRPGPDHAASADAIGFERYTTLAKDAHTDHVQGGPGLTPAHLSMIAEALARPEKILLDQERDVRRVSRQSIVVRADRATPLPAGTILTREDLRFARPGTGIEPWRIDEIVGRELTKDAEPDMPLTLEHLA